MNFSNRLLSWYAQNGRKLPWREQVNPYHIWISEIILQQTRIEQGIDYYYRFIKAFPDVQSLAEAPLDEVLRLWQGLGYYSRARNLHYAAQHIVSVQGGLLPGSYTHWLEVKGVGNYTAAAIASIAYKEPVAALDGNAYRVFSRIFAVKEVIDTAKGKKAFLELAREILDEQNPGDFNQAVMDFGALVCKPVNPLCHECLFNRECLAFLQKKVHEFPLRKKKTSIRERYFHYFYFYYPEKDRQPVFFIYKRIGNDIWKNLYELPLLETSQPLSSVELTSTDWWKRFFPDGQGYTFTHAPVFFRHLLTHQKIHANFYAVQLNPSKTNTFEKVFRKINLEAFDALPKSGLTLRYLKLIRKACKTG